MAVLGTRILPVPRGRSVLIPSELVGRGGHKITLHEVRRCGSLAILSCGTTVPSPVRASQLRLAHQPGHPFPPTPNAVRLKLGVDPRHPVCPTALSMTGPDLDEQGLIRLRPHGDRTLTPRVVPAGGNAQNPGERGDVVHGLLLLHEHEPRYGVEFVSLAKKAAATL